MKRHLFSSIAGLVLAASIVVADDAGLVNQLKEMSLVELMDLDVTTVSKRAEKLSDVSAAIAVMTHDDIRESGARNLPEILRLMPGLNVAQVDAHQWAISARGFNDIFANKLLVLQDGRSVYTPLFSGVTWGVQNVVLEDIDRIEVIRGPGAAIWGANAVNGVINIISRSSKDTQGWLVTGGAGSDNPGLGAVRYGGQLGDGPTFRVSGQYYSEDDSDLRGGGTAHDSLDIGHGGFRIDWAEGANDTLMVEGGVYNGLEHSGATATTTTFPFAAPLDDSARLLGGNLLGRWRHTFHSGSDLQVQTYYDHTDRNAKLFEEQRDTFDLEFQHRFQLGSRQEIMWGGDYRVSTDEIAGSPTVSFAPTERTAHLFGAFLQDEVELWRDRLRLTLGSKLEHNDYTGVEVEPSVRLLWKIAAHHSVWWSVSRAVRTPSRGEDNVVANPPGVPPGFAPLMGDTGFQSEELTAYEIGYRALPVETVTVDLAMFYNVYDRLRTIEPPASLPGAYTGANKMYGETYGGEIVARWQARPWWRIEAQYSLLQMALHTGAGSLDTTSAEMTEGNSPQQQATLRTSLDLPGHVECSGALRYVDELANLKVPAYVTLDLWLAWRPTVNWEIAVVGQNLFSPNHGEFAPTLVQTQTTEVDRSVYGKVTWRY